MKYQITYLSALTVALVMQTMASADDLKQQFTERLLEMRTSDLNQCQQQLQEWKDWGAENKPKHEALLLDYERLKKKNEDLLEDKHSGLPLPQSLAYGVGFGFGAGMITVLVLFWKRLKPTTPKKQLAALVFSAVWIAAAGLIMESNSELSKHPVNLLVSVFIYSLPALMFTGITFWWLKKTKPDVTKLW